LTSLLGPYLAGCVLLVVAGAAKVRRPADTAIALAGLTSVSRARLQPIVRVAAGAEGLLGGAALARPHALLAGLVALSYVAFAGYVLWARKTGGALASCGCFGTPDTPPTVAHVVMNIAFAAAALAVATAEDGRTIGRVLAGQPGHGAPLLLVSGACAVLAFGVYSQLAQVHGARQLFLEDHR
jgi:hypothetical protein